MRVRLRTCVSNLKFFVLAFFLTSAVFSFLRRSILGAVFGFGHRLAFFPFRSSFPDLAVFPLYQRKCLARCGPRSQVGYS